MALELVAVESIDWVLAGPLSQALVTTVQAGDILDVIHYTQGSGGADMFEPTSPAEDWQDTGKAEQATWAPAAQVWSAIAAGPAVGNPTVDIPQNGASRHKADVLIWRGATLDDPPVFDFNPGDDTGSQVTPDIDVAVADSGVVRGVVTRGGPGVYAWPFSTVLSNQSAGSGGAGGVASTAYLITASTGAQGAEAAVPPGDWGEYLAFTFVRPPSGAVDPSEGDAALSLVLTTAAAGARESAGDAAAGLVLTTTATGARESAGAAGAGLVLTTAATGARGSAGAAGAGLVLTIAASGARESAGGAAAGLVLAVAASGATEPVGTADTGLVLTVAASGARESVGAAAAGIVFTVNATGSGAETGRPVTPWPWPPQSVDGFPWTPRAVRSFLEVGP